MAYNSAYTGSQVDAAVGAVRQKETKWDNKQDELTGTEDQIVGFNSAGEAVAVAKPDPLPTGGETGQVLTKTSTGAQWDDIPSDLPAGGTDGQILTKTADGVAWEDAPEGGVTSFNSRTGAITPQAGDYTADMVGAIPTQTGTQGQVLGFTADNTVGAMDAPSGLPDGGTPGQMLYQGESGPEWGDKPDAQQIDFTPGSTGLTAYNVQDAIEKLNDKLPAISMASATLYSGSWTLSGGKYAQTVQISGMTSSARLVLPDPDTPGTDQQADNEVLQAWGAGPAKIAPSAGNGTVTFYSWTQPTINIPIQVVVIT